MLDEDNKPSRKVDHDAIRREVEAEFKDDFGSTGRIEPELDILGTLEDEVGLKEIPLDPAALDQLPADDTNELDADDDGIADDINDSERVSHLPQQDTESYGTGLLGQPSDRTGTASQRREHLLNSPDYSLTGGDVDANYEDAEAVGEEAVGGTVATPDQDVVDELAAAVGVELDDRTDVRVLAMMEERDDRRWELDPTSSEDYQERRD